MTHQCERRTASHNPFTHGLSLTTRPFKRRSILDFHTNRRLRASWAGFEDGSSGPSSNCRASAQEGSCGFLR